MKKKKLNIFLKRTGIMLCMAVLFFQTNIQEIYAFADSKLATGTTKLVSDITTWLSGIALSVGILLGIYFWIRKGAAGEHDQVKWEKALKILGISVVGIVTTSSVISLITSYYK